MKPGIYYDISFYDYQKIRAVNNSVLKIIADRSPAHAKWAMDNGSPDTAALLFGRAEHCLLLEPESFDKNFAVAPVCDRRAKDGKAIWESFCDTVGDRDIITQEDFQSIKQVAETVRQNKTHNLIKNGKPEVVVLWIDKPTGLLCKMRMDYYRMYQNNHFIIDVKTTKDASPREFVRDVWNYGYYQQAGFYTDGLASVIGFDPIFCFFPIEKEPPYCSASYEAHSDMIRAGQKTYRKAIELYAKCMREDNWPGYPEESKMLNLPHWALAETGIGKDEMI